MSRITRFLFLSIVSLYTLISPAAAYSIDDVFTTMDAVYNWIIGLPGYFADLIEALINAILYPIQVIFSMFWHWISILVDSVVSVYTSILTLFNTTYSFLWNISTTLFPGTWGILILIGFTIVVLLRVYYFVKDIEILGFKL